MNEDARLVALQAAMAGFTRQWSEARLTVIIRETKDISDLSFQLSCARLAIQQDTPSNLVAFIRSTGDRDERKHCPDCCYYRDGVKLAHEDGSPMFFPIPGMQHHSKSAGTIYEKLGYTTPCKCPTGDLVEKGFKKDPEYSRPTQRPRRHGPADNSLPVMDRANFTPDYSTF